MTMRRRLVKAMQVGARPSRWRQGRSNTRDVRRAGRAGRWLIAALVATLALAVAPAWATRVARAAAPIAVTSTADVLANDGQCTLREAVIAANTDKASGALAGECPAGSGADTV